MPIRDMKPGDVPEVVRIHLESFGGFFLSFLGPRFLTLLYRGLVSHPRGVALVAETGTGLEGFVAGVTDQSDFYRQLIKKQAIRFALASLGAVARRPAVIPRLFRALGQSRRSRSSSSPACLMSIAVRPGTAGKGLGRDLVAGFGAALVGRGIFEYCLTTDRDGNDRVNQFYRKLGFRLTCDFVTPEGRAMNEYVMTLGGQPPGPA